MSASHVRVVGTAAVAVLVSLLSAAPARADFYVSAAGSDTAAGTSEATAWRTLARVEMEALTPGAIVRFRRGDVFVGSLTLTEDGTAASPIVLSTYGTGDPPVISGLVDVTTWTSLGGGIWEATLPTTRPGMLSVVLIDGAIRGLGRFPRASATDGGYLFFESHGAGATHPGDPASITDAELAASPTFVGAELVIRTEQHVFNRGLSAPATAAARLGVVTSQTGGTLSFLMYPDPTTYPLRDGSPYFLQNHASCLLDDGDWLYDHAANAIRMRGATMPTGVRVAAYDRLVTLDHASHVRIEDLVLEGANTRAIWSSASSSIEVARTAVRFSGEYGMYFEDTDDVTVTDSIIEDSLSNGMRFYGPRRTGFVARGNRIERTGMLPGMGDPARNTYQGLQVNVMTGAMIEGNTVRDSGYNAVQFRGSGITIRHNVIERFCGVLDDGGGIYTWNDPVTATTMPPVFTDRLVEGNIVRHGIGFTAGPRDTGLDASGIYLDLDPMNVIVRDNTVYDVPNAGLTFNNPVDVTVTGNNVIDAASAMQITRWGFGQVVARFASSDNVLVASDFGDQTFGYTDLVASSTAPATRLPPLGTFDGNWLGGIADLPYVLVYADTAGTLQYAEQMHLPAWQMYSGFETTSHALPEIPLHRITSEVTGTELYPTGAFATAADAARVTSPATLTYDAANQRLSIVDPMPRPRQYPLVVSPLGAVQAGHAYRVRVTVTSSVPNGLVRAYFRNRASPYAAISPTISHPVFMGTSMHEFLIVPDTSSTDAAWVIRVMGGTMPVYLDDVSIVEVVGETLTVADTVRFEVNDTASPATHALDGVYTDARGGVHDHAVDLAPYSSSVLFPGGSVVGLDGGTGVGDGGASDGGVLVDASVDAASVGSDGSLPRTDAGTPAATTGSCGCHVGARGGARLAWAALAMLGVLCASRRRRAPMAQRDTAEP